jgi:hypothetical protein
MTRKTTSRFQQNVLTEKLVPILLILILLGLLAVLVIVGLSIAGIMAGA